MKLRDVVWGFEYDALVFSHEGYEASIQADIQGDVMAYAPGRDVPVGSDSPRNRFWVVENGDFYAEGTASTESEAKAAAMVAAWCHAEEWEWKKDEDYEGCLKIETMLVTLGVGENGHWSVANCFNPDEVVAQSVEMPERSVSEAQLAAIMAYEEWKEKGGGNG